MKSVRGRLMQSALSAAFCLSTMTAAGAATSWVNTATQAIPLVQATPLGALPATTSVRVAVALKMQNAQALANLVKDENTVGSASYNTFITPQQFNATYAPSTSSVSAVESYLKSAGLSNIAVTPNNLFVTAQGTAAQVAAAFHTSLGQFSQNGKTIYVNTSPAQVPSSLGGIVLSVLGLNNVAAATPLVQRSAVTPCSVTEGSTCIRFEYNPATYWQAYDVGKTSTGKSTSIAIMAEGNVSSPMTDLRTFEKQQGLPAVPYKVVQVGLASPDTAGDDEWDLDTQYTTGMAGMVKMLYVYTTTSLTDQDTALEFSKWASDDLAQVGNASFGICEAFPYVDGSMVADDQVFLEAAAQGQTMFSSTGDTGSFCSVGTPNGAPVGAPLVSYPATSPYVIGVGGTSLLTNADGSYNGEVAWYAGGGGISQFEYSPYWQSNIIPTNNPNVPEIFRGLPDVAMDADANTGADVVVAGSTEVIGGTSLASPLAVGVWARLQSSYNNRLGFAAPRLYANYPTTGTAPPTPSGALTESVDGFNDILVGANGLYTALPFYDYTTGLGTFDVSQKKAVIPH